MTPAQIAIFVAIFLTVDALVLYAVFAMCASAWKDLSRDYPLNEHATGPWREFQSISIDMFNFGFSVHICADADYVHLAPTRFLRLLRVQPVSIPRSAFLGVKPTALRMARAKLPKHTLTMPRWAAMPDQA
jgi:hypothetical protein